MHLYRSRAHRVLLVGLPTLLLGTLLTSAPAASSAPRVGPTIDRQEETGKVGFIGAPPGRPIDVGLASAATPGTVATAFLQRNATRLGLASGETALRVVEEHPGAAGGRSVRVRQLHAGIPVLGGEFTVNLDRNRDVLSVLGEASPIGEVTTRPAVGARAAARVAIGSVARESGVGSNRLVAGEPELMFYDPRLLGAPGPFQTARLSWVMDVRAARPAVAHTVVVDAATGTVALSFSTIAHARDRVVCDANNTSAQYPCASPVWTESSQPAGVDTDVTLAFEYAGDTYDFFDTRFSRDSLDDAGMQLVSTVDYCPSPGQCPYANAFWDGSQMVYGDGFASADDVVGHELAHGVTDFSSSLFYYMQSGAINESMSDIFGELIDLTNGAGTDTAGVRWQMGEDIPGFGAIRDMEDPPAFGQPDRMLSLLYEADVPESDRGGVHTNSGVSNKAAYLLVDGATFNGHTVNPIALDKTALLFYTVNNDLLVSGSDFADLANALRQACSTLAGAGTGGFTTADCAQVEQAVLATEMDVDPTNAPTGVVERCPSGTPTAVLFDDLETPAGQLTPVATVGSEVWSYPQNPNDVGFDATYATSGHTNIWGYNAGSITDSSLRMTTAVSIPADAYLHFRHAHGFEDSNNTTFYDGGVLEYSTSGAGGPWIDAGPLMSAGGGAGGYGGVIDTSFGNPLGGRSAFVAESNGYGASRADLASLAGQNVMFRWRIGTDSIFDDLGWFIDDISIHSCGAADTTPPNTSITSGPADGSVITTPNATFAFTSSEAGSTFQCRLDAGSFTPCTTPRTLTGLLDGSHTFSVRATDAASNTDPTPATRTFTVALPDTTPPNTSITSGPADGSVITTPNATFAFTSSEAGSTFQCRLDAGSFTPCTTPRTLTGLLDGSHTFSVRATDAASNTDPTPATRTFTVDVPVADTTAPNTTITKHPSKKTFKRKATFRFRSSEAGSSFRCKLDRKRWQSCAPGKTYRRVRPGWHKFRVKATDAAANTDRSPASWRWKVKRRR